MKITKRELKNLIYENLKQEGLVDDIAGAASGAYDSVKGAASSAYDYVTGDDEDLGVGIILVTDADVLGVELKKLTSHKQASEYLDKLGKFIPTGHAYVGVIDPKGNMTGCNFGPPVCKNPKGIIDSVLSANPVPIMTSMTKHVKKGNVGFRPKNGELTAQQAKKAAKYLRDLIGASGKLTYGVFNELDSKSAIDEIGGAGCKAYSIFPVGLGGLEDFDIDADNCGSFAVDVIQAGSSYFSFRNLGLGMTELLTAPYLMARALPGVANHAGTI